MHVRRAGCRCVAAAVVVASTVVALAAPASADFLDRHLIAVLQQVGPTVCKDLDAQPNPFTMGRWVQSLMAVTLTDGWYFLKRRRKTSSSHPSTPSVDSIKACSSSTDSCTATNTEGTQENCPITCYSPLWECYETRRTADSRPHSTGCNLGRLRGRRADVVDRDGD